MRTITPSDAKLIPESAQCVFNGKIFDVYQWQQQLFDGSFATFEMLRRPDTVNIYAIKDDKLVVIKQRQPNTSFFYGPPGGRHDHPAETELQAAKRELLEETGLSFKTWKLLTVVQPQSKIEWFVYTFLATDPEGEVPAQPDAGEEIEVEYMSIEQVRELLAQPDTNRLDMQKDLFNGLQSISDLIDLPEYHP